MQAKIQLIQVKMLSFTLASFKRNTNTIILVIAIAQDVYEFSVVTQNLPCERKLAAIH